MHPVYSLAPPEEVQRVLYPPTGQIVDIDSEFPGFLDAYAFLSTWIPKHWTVVDIGCAYNPQSYYFQHHKAYYAVDIPPTIERFQPPNCRVFEMDAAQFITDELPLLDLHLEETFCICSYVPLPESTLHLVKSAFPKLFLYYPHGTPSDFPRKYPCHS